ncbi:MAG: T9SS type A sorting domain-containing protein [Bacteroidales bacterium]|nr:T9SS type A sorting domain-containing protein [Bacteroidales bacterium]
MKNLSIIIFVVIFCQITALSQPCLPNGIFFGTQAKIDNFQTNHPNCSEIEGDVEINGDNITNLNGLNVLTSIGGSLIIVSNDSLINLTGLENLTYISGNLEVGTFDINYVGNPSLNSLTGLENLDSIGGDFFIYANHALESLSELESLALIGGSLRITHNSALTSLAGLETLTLIGGYLIIGSPFIGNLSLNSLTGLNNVTSIGESIQIQHNDALTSLSGLDNLNIIGGNLWLYDVDNLYNLTGLENLASIGGSLIIGYDYYGFGGNNSLVDLTGLDNLSFIEGDITIEGNPSLLSLTGLENLTSIGGNLKIGYYHCTMFGGLYRWGNPSLTSLTGLNNLSSIGGNLEIYCNDSLTSLSGLENLTSIEGDLKIGDYYDNGVSILNAGNPSLNTLTGLEAVTSIGGYLSIVDNNTLTSLTGLDNIVAASIDSLFIYFNDALSTCEVQSVCDYLASPGGTIEIHDNATGCNSQTEVETACASSIDDININDYISIYPNPGKDILTISCKNGATIDEVVIYNQTGQKVFEGELVNNTIDVSSLPQGLYFIHLQAGAQGATKKVVKIK